MASRKWSVGDLCILRRFPKSEHVVWRIDTVIGGKDREELRLVPAYSFFADKKSVAPELRDASYCDPVSLLDLCRAHASLTDFIGEEASRHAAPRTEPEEEAFCAAIAARDEVQ